MQHIDHFGEARALLRLVHVGKHRHAELFAQIGKNRQRLVEAKAARARRAGAVGLVERGFVNEADIQLRGDLLQRRRHIESVRAAFQRARPGDQGERQRVAEARFADLTMGLGFVVIDTFAGDHEH